MVFYWLHDFQCFLDLQSPLSLKNQRRNRFFHFRLELFIGFSISKNRPSTFIQIVVSYFRDSQNPHIGHFNVSKATQNHLNKLISTQPNLSFTNQEFQIEFIEICKMIYFYGFRSTWDFISQMSRWYRHLKSRSAIPENHRNHKIRVLMILKLQNWFFTNFNRFSFFTILTKTWKTSETQKPEI